MSIYSEIKFSNNLIEGKETDITYSGELFKNGSDSVSIVFGFGNEWNFTTEQKMIKTDEGFKTSIKLYNYSTMNFCFKNSNNQWDNNNYQDYSVDINEEEPEFILNTDLSNRLLKRINSLYVEETEKETEPVVSFYCNVEKDEPINIESSIVNIEDEPSLNNDIENIFSDIYENEENSFESSKNVTPIEEKTNFYEISNFDMDSLVDEILSPITNSSNEQEKNIENIEENTSTQNTELLEIYDNISNFKETPVENPKIETTHDISDLFDEVIYENIENNEVEDDFNTVNTSLNVDEEISLPTLDNEENLIEKNIEDQKNKRNVYLEESKDIPEDHFLISPRSLGKFYMFKKRMKLAFNKIFFALPRFLSKKSKENDNN